jgi:hypothetical protein
MDYKTQTVWMKNAQGFETLRQEVVDRASARDARMSNISNGLAQNTPQTVDLSKMDMKALISDLKKEAPYFNTQKGIALKNGSKIILNQLQKDLENKKSGLTLIRFSKRPDNLERVKALQDEIQQLEVALAQIIKLTGFTLKYDYLFIDPQFV